jgi:NhaA family Na+:H+ antiporter
MKPSRRGRPLPKRIITTLTSPVQRFIAIESASGIVLMAAALAAFLWANSPWAAAYFDFLHVPIGIGAGGWRLELDLHHWVNDLLMALFFFLVGLEIKRELLVGELAGWRKAALPGFGALGGMVVPAAVYVAFTLGTPEIRGWGVPMATDIAFALGVLALLGERVPLALKVFLLALAIVDDLGAVLVIALFYTDALDLPALGLSLLFWALALFYGRAGGGRALLFLLLGLPMWYFMVRSGIHATIAGVLMALAVPLRHGLSVEELREELRWSSGTEFEQIEARIGQLEGVLEHAHSPLHRIEHALAPYVAFLVMPVFAFCNAGVALGEIAGGVVSPVSIGVFLGLLLGKPVGVVAFAWLAVALGLAALPASVRWLNMLGVGLLAGIGFTMSLFIANLAFATPAALDQAKVGVLAASVVAALIGLLTLWATAPQAPRVSDKAAPARGGGA